MRILVTADLHFDIARSRAPAERLAKRACEVGGDAIVLVGDTASADLEPLRQCLGLFEAFPGRRFIVPGNHCLWCREEETSLLRYNDILPRVAREEGFELLDHRPAELGAVGLVGSVGWYDYSFRDRSLGIPEDFYRAKVAPGAAAYLGGHEQILDTHRDVLTEAHMSMGTRWMDGVHIRLGVSDEEFVEMLADKLAAQLDELGGRVDRIVAFLHHLPFIELVPTGRPPRFAFAAAFLGAGRFGEVLEAHPKVTHVYCGHSHWPKETRVGRLTVVNVGSTYMAKFLKVLDL
jgi:predicted phosphohydrolase